ncbi:ubiquinone biosynthesis O-methyltransferase family protein [Coccidioides posadasii C735 delta SOWgp]|uniref:Ubiquinone biosynthesis O-methyltransferase, mitochondrial n=1 Tax=Coccidioides posadasii (strain C735) TaxID=222929 RepID=C5PIE7_COCP7|nr:ubiquinone biosynthesis O-methyltransferase family protein [Coccidioides posadasii C735 delta SOWgp]EER24300.1 ubiquinone biosynthesis O-methyltransferase family protein [Coccidioides posadasii C735 delta SOWgp]|eukprot:XP_003066445.1 ubiquinone biosynthesis O-methyltransferase family protein [Coccidioides posadasii C735 delta SOWgp]
MTPDLRAAAARNLSLLLRHAPRRTTAQFLRHHSTTQSSVSSDELTHFASLASSWWDPLGPSRILHLMNPLRHEFIASCLSEGKPGVPDSAEKNGRQEEEVEKPGLRYLDIGCGGGIFAESLARTIPLSYSTFSTQTNASSLLAIDPSPVMIEIALSHARKDPTLHSHLQSGKFKYKTTTLESLVSRSTPSSSSTMPSAPPPPTTNPSDFDIVTIFEVLEHVDPSTSSPRQFIENCLRLVRPGGWLIGSTIARTWPSFIVNQLLAEAPWPIGVVPRGTHEWSKFVNVDELRTWSRSVRVEEEGLESGVSTRGPPRYLDTKWKCVGAVYLPGIGWKLVPGSEEWGNYFWGIQKLR